MQTWAAMLIEQGAFAFVRLRLGRRITPVPSITQLIPNSPSGRSMNQVFDYCNEDDTIRKNKVTACTLS